MKKLLCAIMCGAAALSLAGCVSPAGIARDITNDVISDVFSNIEEGSTTQK